MTKKSIFIILALSNFLGLSSALAQTSEPQVVGTGFKIKYPETTTGEVNSFSLVMVNDNPFLNLVPGLKAEDDFGYTHGLKLQHTRLKKNGHFSDNERWSVELSSDLYTKDMSPEGQNLFPYTPQKFNEITTIRVRWDNLFDNINSNKAYYVIGAGIGQQNDKYEGGPFAVAQQHGWHTFKHNNLTPDTTNIYQNIPGDTQRLYMSALAAIGKVVSFNPERMADCACEIDRVKLETGVEVLSITQGSRIFILAEVNKVFKKFGDVYVSVDGKIEANNYVGGNRDVRESIGISATGKEWTFKTGMSYIQGDQDEEFLRYVDKDPIWYMLVEKKLK